MKKSETRDRASDRGTWTGLAREPSGARRTQQPTRAGLHSYNDRRLLPTRQASPPISVSTHIRGHNSSSPANPRSAAFGQASGGSGSSRTRLLPLVATSGSGSTAEFGTSARRSALSVSAAPSAGTRRGALRKPGARARDRVAADTGQVTARVLAMSAARVVAGEAIVEVAAGLQNAAAGSC